MNPTLGAYNQGRSYDLDALALYIDQLAQRPSPYAFDEAAQRGEAIFQRADTQCASCHPAPLYTDLRKHDVGTATPDERLGSNFDTPTLKGLWSSAPYLHDGSAATLYDVLKGRKPRRSTWRDLATHRTTVERPGCLYAGAAERSYKIALKAACFQGDDGILRDEMLL